MPDWNGKCHANMSEQVELAEASKEETMLTSVADKWVPTTAAVQSIASGHVPKKISKYES
jgi:hypothetical protein